MKSVTSVIAQWVSTAILMLSILPVAVLAAPQQPEPPTFEEFDKDGDGYVSEIEFNDVRAERMSERAEDGGMMQHAPNAPGFEDLDSDGDGQLSPEELTAAQARRMGGGPGKGPGGGKRRGMGTFEELDADSDGCISREELDSYRAARHAQRQKRLEE